MRFLPQIAIFVSLFLSIWAVGFFGFVAYTISLEPSKERQQTDAIVVLTGGPGRIEKGIELLSSDQTQKLFISGVNTNVTPEKIASLWQTDGKEAPCCIHLGYKAQNTKGNALEIREWIDQNQDIHSIKLVTSQYHMPRATMELRQVLPQMIIDQYPVISKGSEPFSENFWQLAFSEYHKIALSWAGTRLQSLLSNNGS